MENQYNYIPFSDQSRVHMIYFIDISLVTFMLF